MLGVGILARRSVSSSIDFFLSGRSLPARVAGVAFVVDILVSVAVSLDTKPRAYDERFQGCATLRPIVVPDRPESQDRDGERG